MRSGAPPSAGHLQGSLLRVVVVILDTRVESLVGRYHTRADYLHGQCFYDGMCEPAEEVDRRIRETDAYISDAQELASN